MTKNLRLSFHLFNLWCHTIWASYPVMGIEELARLRLIDKSANMFTVNTKSALIYFWGSKFKYCKVKCHQIWSTTSNVKSQKSAVLQELAPRTKQQQCYWDLQHRKQLQSARGILQHRRPWLRRAQSQSSNHVTWSSFIQSRALWREPAFKRSFLAPWQCTTVSRVC